MTQPTLNQVADYFVKVYGADKLHITFMAPSPGNDIQVSTFGDDNIEHMSPWLLLITAKLKSGSVARVSMIVRVFDFENTIEVVGPKGRMSMPHKEIYMFEFYREETVGLNATETMEMHCTSFADTDKLMPVEAGVSFGSGADVVAMLNTR
jgi:hypothetical protein